MEPVGERLTRFAIWHSVFVSSHGRRLIFCSSLLDGRRDAWAAHMVWEVGPMLLLPPSLSS
jgi:hypothetical protein